MSKYVNIRKKSIVMKKVLNWSQQKVRANGLNWWSFNESRLINFFLLFEDFLVRNLKELFKITKLFEQFYTI